MKKNTKIALFSTLFAIFILALLLGSRYDLQISKALAELNDGNYYSSNPFAIIFETFGESIVYILCTISLAIIFFKIKCTEFKKNWLKIFLMVMCILFSLLVAGYCVFKASNYLKIHLSLEEFFATAFSKILLVGITAGLLTLIFAFCSNISDSSLQYLYKWAIAVILVALVSNGIAQVTKHIFDRTRYRAMIYEGYTDFDYYTPWFVINTKKFASTSAFYGDYFKSFPSGHCCAAASFFLLLLLPAFNPNLNNKKYIVPTTILCSLYTILVMISRIVAGAHYLTDTLIGSFITIACIVLYYFVIIKNKKLKYLSSDTNK